MKCDVCGRTDDKCRIRNIKGMCLCSKHLTQYYRYGYFLTETIYDNNNIIVHDDYAEIVLKDKYQNIVGAAQIDLEDVEVCKKYKWHLRKSGKNKYAIASLPGNKKLHLHRLVLGYDGNEDVDHIDHNGLNNRRHNLRIITHADNLRNQRNERKGIKKIPSGRYQAVITKNYREIYLGTYNTYDEALQARLKAE